ncbi:hypothetical protein HYV84_01630 [Candidatus Woesearchaeota archaeon]|nr:hypothetical protein [Candidatus Woesearchaeota archaeon]
MKNVELFVGLKVADNTALTAFHALQRLGFMNLVSLRRFHYYSFFIGGDEQAFKKDIVKVDVLVNSNKNTSTFGLAKVPQSGNTRSVLVQESGDSCSGILKTLQGGLGIKGLQKMERGILWVLGFSDGTKDPDKDAGAIAKCLLYSPHYQRAVIQN